MVKINIYNVLSFLGGAAIGGLITWKCVDKVLEKKYADIAEEEIKSVKEKFTVPRVEIKKNPGVEKQENISKTATNKPSLVEYARKLKDGGYINYSNKPDLEEPKKTSDGDENPYVIDPDMFGDDDEYDRVSLTLYADGILADEDDTIINAEDVVGDALDHMGEYEDDAVHVCNPLRKVYYEILADGRSYENATNKKPHLDDEEDE